MALCEVHWSSSVLAKKVGMYVILPEPSVGPPPYATFYLLHGLSDDYTVWLRRTRVEWYVRDLPLIVVMPDGYRGFYTDNAEGPAYARHMAEELPAFVERNLPARAAREARCVGGLSMGGYGALRLALGYPHRYVSANSHSGAILHGRKNQPRPDGPLSREEFRRIFGERPEGTEHDPVELARRAKAAGKLPRLLMDCGTEDHLVEDNRSFHRALTELNVPHTYREFPGAHDWDYWDRHVQEALAFHAEALGLKPPAHAAIG
jgi:S-formylglutathione hydrolase FrmB